MNSKGANKLLSILDGRAKEHNDKPPFLDFGTIQNDMSLQTNNFPRSIPPTDYVVCRSVALNHFALFTSTSYDGNHPHGSSGEHPHGDSGEHPHGSSGKHPHGGSGDHEHETPDGDLIETSGGHKHPDSEGEHEHPDTEGTHSHPRSEGTHDHPESEGCHAHNVLFPGMMRPIKPGDRVLVAWVGDDACVIDIILSATSINQQFQ